MWLLKLSLSLTSFNVSLTYMQAASNPSSTSYGFHGNNLHEILGKLLDIGTFVPYFYKYIKASAPNINLPNTRKNRSEIKLLDRSTFMPHAYKDIKASLTYNCQIFKNIEQTLSPTFFRNNPPEIKFLVLKHFWVSQYIIKWDKCNM